MQAIYVIAPGLHVLIRKADSSAIAGISAPFHPMKKSLSLWSASLVAGLVLTTNALMAADAPAAAAPAAATPPAGTAPAAAPAAAAPAAGTTPAAAAFKPDLSKLPKASDKTGLTWDKDIKAILTPSCFGCHGGNNPARPSSGYNITTLAGAIAGGNLAKPGAKPDPNMLAGPAIVPGHGDQSPLLIYAAAGAKLVPVALPMPPLASQTRANDPHAALTADQLSLVRAWIDQGAK
jgi:hypothetical protein